MKISLKLFSAKCQPFCSGFDVLINPIKQSQILLLECSTKILAINCMGLFSGEFTIFGSHMLVFNFWWSCWSVIAHSGMDKVAAIFQMTFSTAFYQKKVFVYLFRFPCSLTLKHPVDNKSVLVAWRQQAIAWTNADQDMQCHNASVDHSVLISLWQSLIGHNHGMIK